MDKKVSELTSAVTAGVTDTFPVVQSGTSLKMSLATLFSNVPTAVISTVAAEAPASGALSTAIEDSVVTSATGTTNYTLAAGTQGMRKHIMCDAIAGTSAVVTVTGGSGFTTITFNAVGQTAYLKYTNAKWYVFGSRGVTIA